MASRSAESHDPSEAKSVGGVPLHGVHDSRRRHLSNVSDRMTFAEVVIVL